jgi:hypothetical protein
MNGDFKVPEQHSKMNIIFLLRESNIREINIFVIPGNQVDAAE